jgi:hypothetical protein
MDDQRVSPEPEKPQPEKPGRVKPEDAPDGSCEHCPVRGKGLTCPRHASNHTRFCELTDPAIPARRRRGVVRDLIALAARPVVAHVTAPSDHAEWTPAEADHPAVLEMRAAPSLGERAGYLAEAVVAAVASGGETVPQEERARRLAICKSCEHFDADARRCRVCTCYMPWKVRLASLHCPLPEPRW